MKYKTVSTDNLTDGGSTDLVVAACNGTVRIWGGTGDGKYIKLSEKFVVRSYPDSHLIYFLHAHPKQPDWVEIHSYALLEIGSDRAILQWSRAVNNRDLEASQTNRYFFSQGVTELRRASKICDAKLVP